MFWHHCVSLLLSRSRFFWSQDLVFSMHPVQHQHSIFLTSKINSMLWFVFCLDFIWAMLIRSFALFCLVVNSFATSIWTWCCYLRGVHFYCECFGGSLFLTVLFFFLQVLDDKNVRRRFRASNYQSNTRVKPFICTMPMRLDDGWNQIQVGIYFFVSWRDN